MTESQAGGGALQDLRDEAHILFHALWSKAIEAPGYSKAEWTRLHGILIMLRAMK